MSMRPLRRIFVDLGANIGSVSEAFGLDHPDHELIAIEPNIELLPVIHARSLNLPRPISVIWAAAWTHYGFIDLFKSKHDVASTVVSGKHEHAEYGWSQIDYKAPTRVPALDISSWLYRNVRSSDHVVMKMDIEGAEYEVLEKMLVDGSVNLVAELRCEWHIDRFPDIPRSRHDRIVQQVSRCTKLEDWH
jgi:FkbM family methyltransferase